MAGIRTGSILAVVVIVLGTLGSGAPASAQPVLDCTAPSQPLNFPSYWAGPSFDGLEVSALIRDCGGVQGEPRSNSVSFLYGDCTPTGGGCPLPIEIQSWPDEERNKELYRQGPEEFQIAGRDTTVSGVPARSFEGGRRLEIYHPDATAVVFGDDPARVARFAEALHEAPRVLAELSAQGLDFDEDCLDLPKCEASRQGIVGLISILRSVLVPAALLGVGSAGLGLLLYRFRRSRQPAG